MNVRFTLILAIWLILSFPFATPALGQDASQSDEDSKRSLERFESVLLRSPKKGIALDKVYEAHVQRGDLDDYLRLLESNAEKEGFDTANVFVVIGLLESKRSRDLPAIGWLRIAEDLAPKEPMLSLYRAQSEVFAGKTSDAIESFERALSKNPTKVERLQIEESLGRLYLRTQQRDKAAEVWKRLENAFPKDLLVSERIAQINQTEGNLPEALKRFQSLASESKDKDRRFEFECNAAALQAQSGKAVDAIATYERIASQLKPDSWRYKEMRRRIENIFMATNDFDGWVRYLLNQLKEHPEDIDSEIRLAQAFFYLRKPELAEQRLRDALLRSPTSIELQTALIQQYQSRKDWPKATEAWERLVMRQPNDLDYRIQWGDAAYRASNQNVDKAVAIWSSLPKELQDDVPSILRVSEAMSTVQAWEPAIDWLQKGIALSAEEPKSVDLALELREELGELYWKSGQKEKAITAWKQITDPPNDNINRRRRLVELFRRHMLYREAIDISTTILDEMRASQDAPSQVMVSDFFVAAELLIATKQDREATVAVRDAMNRVDADSGDLFFSSLTQILNAELDTAVWTDFAANGLATSTAPIDQLTAANIFCKLGKQETGLALVSRIFENLNVDSPNRYLVLTKSLEIARDVKQYKLAISICDKLIATYPENRNQWEKQLARFYLQTGQPTKAVEAAANILANSLASSDDLNVCALVCVDANQIEMAVELWNVAIRKDPTYRVGFIQVADSSVKLGRTDEAIANYWKAFDLSESLTEQNSVIQKLAPLYLQRRRMVELTDKLSEIAKEKQSDRLAALWASYAFQAIRSFRQARAVLEPLVQSDSFDPSVVEMLASLSELDRDFHGMIAWQERLLQIDPSDRNRLVLGKFYNYAGDRERACDIYLDIVRTSKEISVRNTAMEYLYLGKHTPAAIEYAKKIAESDQATWEIQGIAMYILLEQKLTKEALVAAQRILNSTESESSDFNSIIPTTIQKGNYVVFQSGTKSSFLQQELNAAAGMTTKLDKAKLPNSNLANTSDWGPIRNFVGLRGAAQGLVDYSLNADARSELSSRYQALLKAGTLTDQQLKQAMILELATPGVKPNEYSARTPKSPEFRALAVESWRRGNREGVDMYITSNLGDPNQKLIEAGDLELVVEVLRNGVPEEGYNYYVPVQKALTELTKKGRLAEAEEIAGNALKTRDGSVRNAVVNFCQTQNNSQLLMVAGKRLTELQPATQLYTTAYHLPSFFEQCLTKELDPPDTMRDLLVYHLDTQATEVAKLSKSMRSNFVSLIDTPYVIQTDRGSGSNLPNNRVFDLTPYLPIELQGAIAAIHREPSNAERNKSWLEELRKIADAPDGVHSKERQAVYCAAVAYVEHLRGNSDARAKYLIRWQDAIEAKDLVDVIAAGIDYRDGRYSECLAKCDQIAPTSFATNSGLTRLRLQASLKTGNIELSRRVATSMATTGLSMADQIKLAKTLGELQLPEKGLELLDSIRFRVPFTSLRDVMNVYDSLGAKESAIEIAYEIVRKTAFDAYWNANITNYTTSNQPDPRQEAINYLKGANALGALRDELKKQFDASPAFERSAIQLANIAAAMGDFSLVSELRKKFNQPEPKTDRSNARDLLGSGMKKLSLAEIEKMLKEDPKAWSKLRSDAFGEFSDPGKADSITKAVLPYVDQTGWGSAYWTLIANLERRNDALADELMEKLVQSYGFIVFSQAVQTAHYRYLTERSTVETRKKITDTLIDLIRNPSEGDIGSFSRLRGLKPVFLKNALSDVFLTSALLDVLGKEPANLDALKAAAEEDYQSNPNRPILVDLLVQFAIREKRWDDARKIANDFSPGDQHYNLVSLAESICEYAELQSQAMKLLDIAAKNLPFTNSTFVQLYVKVATAEKAYTKRDEFLAAYYEWVLKSNTNTNYAYQMESGVRLFIENNLFGESMQLLRAMRKSASKPGDPMSDFTSRAADSLEASISAALKESTAIEYLLQVARQGDSGQRRLEMLMEPTVERLDVGDPYQCSMERLLEQVSRPSGTQGVDSDDQQKELNSLRANLIQQIKEWKGDSIASKLGMIRIAICLEQNDLVQSMTDQLCELNRSNPLNLELHGNVLWYVASEALKLQGTRKSGEQILQLICASPEQVKSPLQYQVALVLGLAGDQSELTGNSNPWLKKVLDGFANGSIRESQKYDVALRLAERGAVQSSVDLFKNSTKIAAVKNEGAEKPKVGKDTRKIAGLATEATAQVGGIVTYLRQPQIVYSVPFASEWEESQRLVDLIRAWEKGGIPSIEINDLVDSQVLRTDSVWLGWLNKKELQTSGSILGSPMVLKQRVKMLDLDSIGLRKRSETDQQRMARQERIRQSYMTTDAIQDRLSLALLEESTLRSRDESIEFRSRALRLLDESQKMQATTNEVKLLSWILAMRLARAWQEGPLPNELLSIFGRDNDHLVSQRFMEMARLEAMEHVAKHNNGSSTEVLEKMITSFPESRREPLAIGAMALLQEGRVDLALDYIQRGLQTPERYGLFYILVRDSIPDILDKVDSMTPEERFELLLPRLLVENKLVTDDPANTPTVVHHFQCSRPTDLAPSWARTSPPKIKSLPAKQYIVGLLDYLVEDAKQLGRLEEVAKRIQQLENSEYVALPALKAWYETVSRGETTESTFNSALQALEQIKKVSPLSDYTNSTPWLFAALYERLLATNQFEKADRLFVPLQSYTDELWERALSARIYQIRDEYRKEADASNTQNNNMLRHWLSASHDVQAGVRFGSAQKSRWSVDRESNQPQEKTEVRIVYGPLRESLFLKYPLSGDFRIQLEASHTSQQLGAPSLGGLAGSTSGTAAMFGYVGYRSRFYLAPLDATKSPGMTRWELTRDKDKLRIQIDGSLIAEVASDGFDSFPFFGIHSLLSNSKSFRGIRLESLEPDQPIRIAKSVRMLHPTLPGWSSEYTETALPKLPVDPKFRVGGLSESGWQYAPNFMTETEPWTLEQEAIRIPEMESKKETDWSCISYQRPLDRSETWSYSLWYDKGQAIPTPVLGRTAIHLEGEFVSKEFLVTKDDAEWLQVQEGKRFSLTNSKHAKLRDKEWNDVQLTREVDIVLVRVNNEEVGRLEISQNEQTYPGIYTPAGSQGCKLRNMELRGTWPEFLPANLWE
ncbi:MAG: DUF1583 domain-containing protein [Pirellula sp.]